MWWKVDSYSILVCTVVARYLSDPKQSIETGNMTDCSVLERSTEALIAAVQVLSVAESLVYSVKQL